MHCPTASVWMNSSTKSPYCSFFHNDIEYARILAIREMDLSDCEEHASFINEQFRPMELAEICCRLTTDHSKEVQRLNDCIQQLTHQITRKNETIECLLRSEEEYFVLTKELNAQIQHYKDRLEQMIDDKTNHSTVNAHIQTDPVWKVKSRHKPKETLKWMPFILFWIMLIVKVLLTCRTKSFKTRETNTDPMPLKQKSIKYKVHRKIKASLDGFVRFLSSFSDSQG